MKERCWVQHGWNVRNKDCRTILLEVKTSVHPGPNECSGKHFYMQLNQNEKPHD